MRISNFEQETRIDVLLLIKNSSPHWLLKLVALTLIIRGHAISRMIGEAVEQMM